MKKKVDKLNLLYDVIMFFCKITVFVVHEYIYLHVKMQKHTGRIATHS